ncbi:uncharacterized protein LOC143530063 [Bidens hawaiensis]|uniref:uncharacterized protein LOC143530063 n=1 Tax=Bidens hawaiensis TaxID=980011 RepID=UPI00404B0A95
MEDLSWEKNMWCPFSNINHHRQETDQETFVFASENIFLNPITTTTDTSFESLDCLLSATNSNADTSSDHDDGISVIFPDYKNSHTNNNNNNNNNNTSVAKEPDDPPRSKKPRLDPVRPISSTINFRQGSSESDETDSEAIAQMKEMIYRAAAFRPVSFGDDEVGEKPKRKNVRISSDPQTVAARQRREKISERIRVLQKLVPGGNKMDTASMLDEAANYLKFLTSQVKALEQFGQKLDCVNCGISGNTSGTSTNADCTSQLVQNIDPNVTLGVPFPMQSCFLPPYQPPA